LTNAKIFRYDVSVKRNKGLKMKMYINDKIYTDDTINEIEGSFENFQKGYYRCKQDYKTIDGIEFTYVCSNFSNISDYYKLKEYTTQEICEEDVYGAVQYDIAYEDKSYEIEEIEEKLTDEYYEDEWEGLKEELEVLKDVSKKNMNVYWKNLKKSILFL